MSVSVGFAALVTTVKAWFKGKARMYLEYLLIGCMVVAATLSVTMWAQSRKAEGKLTAAQSEIANLKGRVSLVEQVNSVQAETIGILEHLRKVDSDALTGLTGDYATLTARDKVVRQRLSDLEKQNAEVRAFLDTPLPADLRELLNDR